MAPFLATRVAERLDRARHRSSGSPSPSPAITARAAASASMASYLPRRRRSWRFGRFTSSTRTPRAVRKRASPAPQSRSLRHRRRRSRHGTASRRSSAEPWRVGRERRDLDRRPSSSSTAATWTSLWVSTPPMIRCAMVVTPPSFRRWEGVARTSREGGQDSEGAPLHRRLFGHGRPTGACTERASLTRPTGHLQDNQSVRPFSGSDRVSGALSTTYAFSEGNTCILTAVRHFWQHGAGAMDMDRPTRPWTHCSRCGTACKNSECAGGRE